MAGIILGVFVIYNNKPNKYVNYFLFYFSKFFFNAGFFNHVYNEIFLKLFKISYFNYTKLIEKGYLEFLGPFGAYVWSKNFSSTLAQYSSPVLFLSLGFMFIGLIIFISLLFLHVQLFIFLLINAGLIPIAFFIFFVSVKI
jgi:hypothetical protein